MPDKRGRRSLTQRALDAQKQRQQEQKDRTDESIPAWYRSLPARSTMRWTIVLVFVIVAVAIVRGANSHPAPVLATNCTTPALALSASSTPKGDFLQWSGTGPPHQQVVLAIGVRGFTDGASAKELTAIPDRGLTAADVQQASTVVAFSTSCRATGRFRVIVPPGTYQVRLFRLNGEGSSLSTTPVASRPLTVT